MNLLNMQNDWIITKATEAKHGVKFGSMNNSDVARIATRICILLGAGKNNIPGNTEADIFFPSFRTTFFDRTQEEIELAIMLVNRGNLEYSLTIYDKMLNVTFIGGLMRAYDKYINEIKIESLKQQSKQITQIEARPTDAEIDKMLDEGFKRFEFLVRTDKHHLVFGVFVYYDHLKKKGKLPDQYNYENYLDAANAEMQNEAYKRGTEKSIKLALLKITETTINNEAKKLALIDFILKQNKVISI